MSGLRKPSDSCHQEMLTFRSCPVRYVWRLPAEYPYLSKPQSCTRWLPEGNYYLSKLYRQVYDGCQQESLTFQNLSHVHDGCQQEMITFRGFTGRYMTVVSRRSLPFKALPSCTESRQHDMHTFRIFTVRYQYNMKLTSRRFLPIKPLQSCT